MSKKYITNSKYPEANLIYTKTLDNNKKRHLIGISNEAYLKSKEMAEKERYNTLVDYVNETLLQNAERGKFLNMYASFLKQDYVSEDAVYIKDSKINKIAIVRLLEYSDEDLNNSGYYVFCETCASDSCIHVRYSLATGSVNRLRLSERMA